MHNQRVSVVEVVAATDGKSQEGNTMPSPILIESLLDDI